MEFLISITTDNAAFEVEGAEECADGQEVARILRKLADEVQKRGEVDRGHSWTLMDSNGNKVGLAEVQGY